MYIYHTILIDLGGIRGTVLARWTGLLANRSSDRSCARGKINNKIHHIRPGCLRPSIATVQNHGLKHYSFIPYRSSGIDIHPVIQTSVTRTQLY